MHIQNAEDLREKVTLAQVVTWERSELLHPPLSLATELIREQCGAITFTRCIFGNEFCEHLLPLPAALQNVIEAAAAQNLTFTFLTPYVSNDGLATLKPLFDVLAQHEATEVVFNDWGVLQLLRRDYPSLIPVQGRLLNKSLRDPRVTTMYASAPAPASALNVLQRSNLDNASYAALLARFGVRMIEMDNLPQGNDLSFVNDELSVAVYLPFGFISTSRVCMAAGLHYHKPDKFRPSAPCRHECQTHLLEYQYTNSPFGNREQRFYLKGNTYFYAHSETMLRALLAQAQSGKIARLIFQPRLPMMD
ncbi:MAG: hypothetical protein U0Y68_23500 [Blastocatellia bacterium]